MKSWRMWGSHPGGYLGTEFHRGVTKGEQGKIERQEKTIVSEEHQDEWLSLSEKGE